MLGKGLNAIIHFFYTRKLVFGLFLMAVLATLSVGVSKLSLNENIFSTLPKGNTYANFFKFIDQENLSNQLIISLDVENLNTEEIDSLSTIFTDSIESYTKDLLYNLVTKRSDAEKEVYNYYYQNLPVFISDNYYSTIENKIKPDSIRANLIHSQRNLLSPSGFALKDFILNDPVYISSSFFSGLNKNNNFSNLTIEDGYIFSEDKQFLFISAQPNFSLSDNKKNVELYTILNDFKSDWNNTYQKNSMDYFGTFMIGAENSVQIKKDTFLTIIITIIVILLILFLFYRKLLIPIYFMFPIVFGGLFALGLIGFLKTEISGISLATGAVVFGIIIDFCFHFFTHLQHSKSISKTIDEISFPLLTGGFTTIMAFMALLFTNSSILQDFGLFASLSLIGAILFTLIGLPVILKLIKFKPTEIKPLEINFTLNFSKKSNYILLAIVIGVTGFFMYHSFDVAFDGDLDNLSYHNKELKEKEERLVGINPEQEKKLFIFAEATSFEKANNLNYKVFQKIQELEADNKIKSALSVSKFIIPDSVAQLKFNKWEDFWSTRKQHLFNHVDNVSDSLGFSENAFSNFKNWISSTSSEKSFSKDNDQLFKLFELDKLINVKPDKTTIVTTLVVDKKNIAEVQAEIESLPNVFIFNKSEIAKDLLSTVKNDFNFILLVSSLLVFISLLVIYGRIELALFTFIPMVISWIWILGIASLFGMSFNFVNIVIATFIFGLGDDFSIFITDGLLNKYKHKKNTLNSYNQAIILSAITTMVGLGVLFFAKHPAIHSISIISVLGILCILLVSMVVQPLLFNLFVQNRVENKKNPLTLIAFLVSVFEFSWFVIGCFFAYIVLIVLIILPIPKKNKRYLLNSVLSISSASVIYSAFHVRKKIYNRENLDFNNPSIIIANHTSFLDILLLIMLTPKVIIVVKDWVYNSFLFGPIVRYVGYIYIGKSPEENLKIIQSRIKDGYSIVIFPEGARSENDTLRRFHKGAFFLAQELNLDITPVLIHGASYVLPKSEFFVKHGALNMKVLPRIKANDLSWGKDFGRRTKSISALFKQEYINFKNEQENSKGLFPRVFSNYVYKGPITEWYIRIKWKFESKNYEHYNELLKSKTSILDVGCGYGYLSYFLHYKDENRKITGIDYDEEKISIASNGFDKNENLRFEHTDVFQFNFQQYDAILLNDVLHYFSEEKQLQLLKKCILSLNEDGIILIRDGITDFESQHKKTELSEKYSTQILSFNRKEEDFHFFSSKYIYTFAKENNFSCELIQHSNKTSNVLFILKKIKS